MLPRLLFLALLMLPVTAPADDDRGDACRGRRQHDCARAALQRGEIRPLTEVLAAVLAAVPGDVVELELDRKRGRWIYEVKVLGPDARRREVEIDARTLRILEID